MKQLNPFLISKYFFFQIKKKKSQSLIAFVDYRDYCNRTRLQWLDFQCTSDSKCQRFHHFSAPLPPHECYDYYHFCSKFSLKKNQQKKKEKEKEKEKLNEMKKNEAFALWLNRLLQHFTITCNSKIILVSFSLLIQRQTNIQQPNIFNFCTQ